MTTLTGSNVYDYLNDLEGQIKNLKESNSEESSNYRVHKFLGSIVGAEREFLKQINNGSAMISILGNGMPSIESLTEDIKSMGKLEESVVDKKEDLELFERISNSYTESLKSISTENGPKYKTIGSEDFANHLEKYDQNKLISKIDYSIKENENKFELVLRESFFITGFDEHSQKFPVAVRENSTDYQVVWNNLTSENKETCYVPSNMLVVKSAGQFQTVSEKEIFKDIKIEYSFKRRDYKNISVHGIFGTKKVLSKDFKKLVEAGANKRIKVTNNIISTLNDVFNSDISIDDSTEELTAILANNNFASNLHTSSWWYDNLDLISDKSSNKKIGVITYYSPTKRGRWSGILVWIDGSKFENEKQYLELKKKLSKKLIIPK